MENLDIEDPCPKDYIHAKDKYDENNKGLYWEITEDGFGAKKTASVNYSCI